MKHSNVILFSFLLFSSGFQLRATAQENRGPSLKQAQDFHYEVPAMLQALTADPSVWSQFEALQRRPGSDVVEISRQKLTKNHTEYVFTVYLMEGDIILKSEYFCLLATQKGDGAEYSYYDYKAKVVERALEQPCFAGELAVK